MRVFTCDDLGESYRDLIQMVLDEGDLVAPRGMPIKEIRALVLEIQQPELCQTVRPNINRALMWMEIAQLIAGGFDHQLFSDVSPLASKLLSAGGAYGPRTASQLEDVVAELVRDPDSRRAVVYVGRPHDLSRTLAETTTDLPCTMTWQFFVRGGRLEMVVNMRSWDLVWGLANDVPCFVAVQQCLAEALRLEVGPYVHLAGSAHVYERHWDIVPQIKAAPGRPLPSVAARRGTSPDQRWRATVDDACEAVGCAKARVFDRVPPQWEPASAYWEKRLTAGGS